jgi:hypothetical protein
MRENWLPAQRRHADEPVDDWKWALRSTANPAAAAAGGPGEWTGVVLGARSSRTRSFSQGRITLTNGDGAFGDGGMHQALLLNRTMGDGDGAMLSADLGEVQTGSTPAPAPSVAVSTGYERHTPLGGSTRLMSSFQSHPELVDGPCAGLPGDAGRQHPADGAGRCCAD